MIINIRGTSGSGKTYTARQFMEYCGTETLVHDGEGKVVAHAVYFDMVPVHLIGSYANVCGGCDTIKTQDMVCSLVRHFSQFGHVIFEGLLISHLYARYAALWQELNLLGYPFVFAFMDTPLEISIERVKQRRLEKGNKKKFNPKNTISHHHATLKTKDKFDAAGIHTAMIDYTANPINEVMSLIMRDMDYAFEHSYREESFR